MRSVLNNISLSVIVEKGMGFNDFEAFTGLKAFSTGGIITLCLIALAYGFLWILSPLYIPMLQSLVLFNERRNVQSLKTLLSDKTSGMFFDIVILLSVRRLRLDNEKRLNLSSASAFASVVKNEGGYHGARKVFFFLLFLGKPAYARFSLRAISQCDGAVGELDWRPGCRHNREMWCYQCVSHYTYTDTHIHAWSVCMCACVG